MRRGLPCKVPVRVNEGSKVAHMAARVAVSCHWHHQQRVPRAKVALRVDRRGEGACLLACSCGIPIVVEDVSHCARGIGVQVDVRLHLVRLCVGGGVEQRRRRLILWHILAPSAVLARTLRRRTLEPVLNLQISLHDPCLTVLLP